MTEPRDFVDGLIESWARSRPDLDVTPVAVATRIGRIRDHLEGEMAGVFGAFGLTAPTFAMLASILRLGDPVGETELADAFGMSAHTIAIRLDRLIGDGLVERAPGGAVALTERGRELVEQAVPAHLDNLARLLSALGAEEQATLADLLRKLLLALEEPLGPAT